jgi:hypothetical protein
MIQGRGKALCSEIHKRHYSVWNKEELPYYMESFIVTGQPRFDSRAIYIHRGEIYISQPPLYPDRLWGPHRLLRSGNLGSSSDSKAAGA